jgi:hypothetical protein
MQMLREWIHSLHPGCGRIYLDKIVRAEHAPHGQQTKLVFFGGDPATLDDVLHNGFSPSPRSPEALQVRERVRRSRRAAPRRPVACSLLLLRAVLHADCVPPALVVVCVQRRGGGGAGVVVCADTLHVATRYFLREARARGDVIPRGARVRWRAVIAAVDLGQCMAPDASVSVPQLLSGEHDC